MKRSKLLYILLMVLVLASAAFARRPKRTVIRSVEIEGTRVYKPPQLYPAMLGRPSRLLYRKFYNSEILLQDLRSLELYYQQRGFLEAKVEDHKVEIDSVKRQARIFIRITEGERTHIEAVNLLGNMAVSDSVLLGLITVKAGDPLRRKNIENSNLALMRYYADRGYLDAEIVPEIKVKAGTHLALVDFVIAEKEQFRVNSVIIQGLEKTRENVVVRELSFHSGEVINYSRLMESQRKLYLTGLFSSVFIRPAIPGGKIAGTKDALIEVKENKFGEFNVSIGYGTIDQLRGKMEVFYTNLRGRGQKIGFASKLSFIERGVEISFTEPWTFATRWRTDLNLSTEFLNQPGYDLLQSGGRATVGRSIDKRSSATITYRYEDFRLSHIRVAAIPDEMKSNIRSLKLALKYDTRDNLFATKSGCYIEWSNELAGTILQGLNSFYRTNLELKYFYSPSSSLTFGSGIDLGWISAAEGIASVSLNERYYAGGPNVMRSFRYQRLGPLDSAGIPTGGIYKTVWNVIEMRKAVYKGLGLECFLDAGNVWDRKASIRMTTLENAVGLGIRYDSPIGLVRVDYAVRIYPRSGIESGLWYLSMGQSF